MTRSELIDILCKKHVNFSQEIMSKIVDTILNQMSEELEKGGRVEIRGFGSFSTRKRDQRITRNPRTNAVTVVPERLAVYFRSGKDFLDILNDVSNDNRLHP